MAAKREYWTRNYDRRLNGKGIFHQYHTIITILICLQQSFEDAEKKKKEDEEEEGKPDPLTQLVTTFCRGAMTERSGALQEDALYMSYAQIAAKSCGEEEEDGGDDEGGDEGEGSTSIHVSCKHAS